MKDERSLDDNLIQKYVSIIIIFLKYMPLF